MHGCSGEAPSLTEALAAGKLVRGAGSACCSPPPPGKPCWVTGLHGRQPDRIPAGRSPSPTVLDQELGLLSSVLLLLFPGLGRAPGGDGRDRPGGGTGPGPRGPHRPPGAPDSVPWPMGLGVETWHIALQCCASVRLGSTDPTLFITREDLGHENVGAFGAGAREQGHPHTCLSPHSCVQL